MTVQKTAATRRHEGKVDVGEGLGPEVSRHLGEAMLRRYARYCAARRTKRMTTRELLLVKGRAKKGIADGW